MGRMRARLACTHILANNTVCSHETVIPDDPYSMTSLSQDGRWDGTWLCPKHLAEVDPKTVPFYGAIRQRYILMGQG